MSATDQTPKPKRRWNQFSLKTLLIVVTLFTVTVGWIGLRVQRARRNRDRVATITDAVAAIEKSGGRVTIMNKERRPKTSLEEQFDDPGDAYDPVRISTAWRVEFGNTVDTDSGLEHLKAFERLQSLDLSGTTVTDAGLEHLKGLLHLRYLSLADTKVTDVGLEQLKGLESLEELNLEGTNVTDTGLEQLKGMKILDWLFLEGTQVTKDGVKKLQDALPQCRIYK